MRHLFVGGPIDGQWKEADGINSLRVAVARKSGVYGADLSPMRVCGEQHVYEPRMWMDEEKRAVIYVSIDLRHESILPRLLANYRPGHPLHVDLYSIGSAVDAASRRVILNHIGATGQYDATLLIPNLPA